MHEKWRRDDDDDDDGGGGVVRNCLHVLRRGAQHQIIEKQCIRSFQSCGTWPRVPRRSSLSLTSPSNKDALPGVLFETTDEAHGNNKRSQL